MTLDQFIRAKPDQLRLGQWFVNCYFKEATDYSCILYNINSDFLAAWEINLLLGNWQWDNLPDVDTQGRKIV